MTDYLRPMNSLRKLALIFTNIPLVIKDQMPPIRLVNNIVSGDILGILSKRSHMRLEGIPKVMYNTKESANRAVDAMPKKFEAIYSSYKCLYCKGFHVGK